VTNVLGQCVETLIKHQVKPLQMKSRSKVDHLLIIHTSSFTCRWKLPLSCLISHKTNLPHCLYDALRWMQVDSVPRAHHGLSPCSSSCSFFF